MITFQVRYNVILKDGTLRYITVDRFREHFPVAGHNFRSRLTQLQTLLPANEVAVDWSLDEVEEEENIGGVA